MRKIFNVKNDLCHPMKSYSLFDIFENSYKFTEFPYSDIIYVDWNKGVNNVSECACGSKCEPAYCHPDLNQESLVATILKRYNDIDDFIIQEKQNQNIELICKKGCNLCCKDYFYISPAEYFALKYIMINNDLNVFKQCVEQAESNYILLKKEHPKEYARLESVRADVLDDDHEYLNRFFACPLLCRSTGECLAYKVRPIVCRMYGTSYYGGICDTIYKKVKKIWSDDFAPKRLKKHLVNINPRSKSLQQDIVFHYLPQKNPILRSTMIHERSYPLIYWLQHDDNYLYEYNMAVKSIKSDYIKHIYSCYAE